MDRGAWQATIHGVAKSPTRLKQLSIKYWRNLFMNATAAAAVAKSLQLCPTLCGPRDGSPPGSPSVGFSRQEHWSRLLFPSPIHENEVAQLCPTLSNPMDCSSPGSSIHGIFQARVLEWGAIAFSVNATDLTGILYLAFLMEAKDIPRFYRT